MKTTIIISSLIFVLLLSLSSTSASSPCWSYQGLFAKTFTTAAQSQAECNSDCSAKCEKNTTGEVRLDLSSAMYSTPYACYCYCFSGENCSSCSPENPRLSCESATTKEECANSFLSNSVTAGAPFVYNMACVWTIEDYFNEHSETCRPEALWQAPGTHSEICADNPLMNSVHLSFNPEYITQTIQNRKFDPRKYGMTPFDDVDCELRVESQNNPASITYPGSLIVSGNREPEKTITSGTLTYNKTEEGYDYYIWAIKGWSNGWIPDVSYFANKHNVKCQVNITGKQINSLIQSLNFCVKIEGTDNEKFSIATVAGASIEFSSQEIVAKAIASKEGAFDIIDPFMTYADNFGYYVDTDTYSINDDDWRLITYPDFVNGNVFAPEIGSKIIPSESVCRGKTRYLVYSKYLTASYARIREKTIFLTRTATAATVMHEFGHSFCGLFDETGYLATASFWNGLGKYVKNKKNCVEDYTDRIVEGFQKEGTYYGDGIQRKCGFSPDYYVPSINSIMFDSFKSPKFNTISCGYCLKTIKKAPKSSQYLFDECMGMDTIKPGTECTVKEDCTTIIAGEITLFGGTNNYDYHCIDCINSRCTAINERNSCTKNGATGICNAGYCTSN